MALPKVVLTAPERIWLQVSDQEYDKDVDFPIDSEVTWCQDSVLDCEVAYIRDDLAESRLAAADALLSKALPHVQASAGASHLTDGFRRQEDNALDLFVREIQAHLQGAGDEA